MYRYNVLYTEATQEGMNVTVPVQFQRMHETAYERPFLTRTDTIVVEALSLQSGVHFLVQQYKNDIYRMHDTIVQNIRILHTIETVGKEIVFPERDEVALWTKYLEWQFSADTKTRTISLESLVNLSHEYVAKARADYEHAQKDITLADIEDMRHEIIFLDSFYRVNPDTKLSFEKKTLDTIFQEYFSKKNLSRLSSEELQSSWTSLSNLLEPYRLESRELRKLAREKRADLVVKEKEKWTDTPPPEAPIIDVYQLIFISLRYQTMYVYEDGELILSTSITSGRQDYETVRGTFKVYTKQRNKLLKSPFPEEEYELWVDYWMGFYGGYGIHDACNSRDCWRTRFGGASYVYNGSHGCINTPYNAVKFIYNWANIGTTVYVK